MGPCLENNQIELREFIVWRLAVVVVVVVVVGGRGGASNFQLQLLDFRRKYIRHMRRPASQMMLGLPSSPSLTFPEISRQNRKHHQKKTAPSSNNPTERRSSLTPVSWVLPSHAEFKAA